MNVPFIQENRRARLTTSLAINTLVLLRMDGHEELSGDFTWTVEALSADPDVDLNALLGTHATIEMDVAGGQRYFDGIVTAAQWCGMDENGNRYDIVLRPWLHVAGLRRNQRIFHRMSVDQILKELLGVYAELGNPHLELELTDDYPTLEYTVQYNESDADFARRQMERFGITWHWVHENGNHKLVLTDRVSQQPDVSGGNRPYYGVEGYHMHDEEHFDGFRGGSRLTTGAVRLTEYNFKSPHAAQEVDQVGEATHAQGQIESFDWPGDYLKQSEGRGVVNTRVQAETGQAIRYLAKGDVASLGAGWCVTPTGDTIPGVTGQRMLCLRAQHIYRAQAYGSGDAKGGEEAYEGSYVLMPDTAPMRPERRTRVPLVHGPQTAVVVGSGEIDCDEYGRILVQFHWDLDGAYSMRCRVSQNWAGRGWGGMVIPRIGMEVVVEFLEGDPDKPLVTGCVYNGANPVPYDLPANKTRSTFKTDTHEGSGFNELMFEDLRDEELIYMHGQKDQEIEILNDRRKSIGRDESNTIARDRSQVVGQDETMNVGRDQRETVGQDVYYEVKRNQQEKYGKDHVHNVGNIHKQDIFADHIVQVGRNREETVLGKSTLDVTQSITNNTGKHTLMAFEKFTIKGPGGKITIDGSGITLEAARINLKGSVSMGGGGSAQVPTLQGAARDALPLVEECLTQKEE
ncbi:type VI secretion system tip protein VgrG [Sulfitobacter albidus]|uniref:Type VI secretion system tip protein VgrG n=1 Tax=Sulfitobacter albidus TaxID=2829501 RepID=A0A975PNR6_9RHOB|nr:type VI secretion system tip protein TssI/VgrG [Sulfitobacter albidus]QUJ78137.1 type VI secretion system tip protein VgrG [Sulfitobacter albidus]